MCDYSKGQIYKVQDKKMKMCYIGSTTQPLSTRMAQHRRDYLNFLANKKCYISVFELFNKFGVDNCKIIWVEDYVCNSKKELDAREGHHIKETDCVNKRIEGRDKKQYYQDRREHFLEKAQIHRDNHREERKEYFKQRYIDKKEEIVEKKKEHIKNNLEKVREQARQSYHRNKAVKNRPYTCECGLTLCHSGKARHEKTQKHQQYLQSINQNNPQEPAIDQS